MKVVLTLMSSFYWMDIEIYDRVFEVWKFVSSLSTFFYFFFVCWSQNAASLVLLRSPMQRQSGSNIGNFQKIIDFQKIAFAMCNLQCQWRTLFSQIKQKPSTWFENPLWGEIWSRSFWRSQFFFLPWKLMSMSLPSWFFHKKGFFYF